MKIIDSFLMKFELLVQLLQCADLVLTTAVQKKSDSSK